MIIPKRSSQGVLSAGAVQMLTADLERSGSSGTVYSGIRFSSDGNVYARKRLGGYSKIYTWLLNGANSDYFLTRVTNSGTLGTDDGAGPQVMSSDRDYDLLQTGPGQNTAVVTFEISSDISGTPIEAGPNTYTFDAIIEM